MLSLSNFLQDFDVVMIIIFHLVNMSQRKGRFNLLYTIFCINFYDLYRITNQQKTIHHPLPTLLLFPSLTLDCIQPWDLGVLSTVVSEILVNLTSFFNTYTCFTNYLIDQTTLKGKMEDMRVKIVGQSYKKQIKFQYALWILDYLNQNNKQACVKYFLSTSHENDNRKSILNNLYFQQIKCCYSGQQNQYQQQKQLCYLEDSLCSSNCLKIIIPQGITWKDVIVKLKKTTGSNDQQNVQLFDSKHYPDASCDRFAQLINNIIRVEKHQIAILIRKKQAELIGSKINWQKFIGKNEYYVQKNRNVGILKRITISNYFLISTRKLIKFYNSLMHQFMEQSGKQTSVRIICQQYCFENWKKYDIKICLKIKRKSCKREIETTLLWNNCASEYTKQKIPNEKSDYIYLTNCNKEDCNERQQITEIQKIQIKKLNELNYIYL